MRGDMTKRALSVLHIGAGRYSPNDRGHGTFSIWRELGRGFSRYTVVGRSTAPRSAVLEEGSLAVHLAPSLISSESEFLLMQFFTLNVARRVKPDVVVAQCPVLGGLAGLATGAPVLMELHGAHYFARPTMPDRNSILRGLARLSLPRATRIRALSSGMKARLLAVYGDDLAERTVVLPPRVDLSVFAAADRDWSIKNRRPIALMVGGVNDNKGQARFLTSVLSTQLDIDVWIAGDGPDRELCQQIVSRHGAEVRVRFFGHVTQGELATLLVEADVLVQYSRTEGTPRAVLEAMASGLPVITTPAGFVADILPFGGQGQILGATPDDEIVGALTTLFADVAQRERLGRAGRVFVEQAFDAEEVFERYRSLIAETAAR